LGLAGDRDKADNRECMDRLSLLDSEFLNLEDGIAHLHIAGISVFEGPAPPAGRVEQLIGSKLDRISRYRQRVRSVPFELGRPVWVDDPHFDLSYHARRTALPAPAGDAEFCALIGRVMSQPLNRERPLWEAWVVENLPDGHWALISKIHHCMVDGIAGVDLLTVLLEARRDVDLPTPKPWTPKREPSGPAMVVDAWRGLAGDLLAGVRHWPAAARDPRRALQAMGALTLGSLRWLRHLVPNPPLQIEGHIGPDRVYAHSSASFADVRIIRDAFGGTVNDVVLAAVTRGYHELMLASGDDPDHAVLRTLVPVSVRDADGRGVPDNRVTAVLLELPVALDDPVERLRVVRARMEDLKHSHMADAGRVLTEMGDLAPPMAVGTATRVATRLAHRLPQQSINTVTTNVPGPPFPLYCLGREMLAYYPFVPISHGLRIGTAILSYNGQLAFGVTGDFDAGLDVDLLATACADGIAELRALALHHGHASV
jgi:diacylglycerol O-acyltransferase